MKINEQSVFLKKMRNVVSDSGLLSGFPLEAIEETAEIESMYKWPFIGKRLDLRGKTTFTMGSLETAFSVEKDGSDYILGIHSVDAACLFPMDSALDEAAFLRGKAACFPGKVYSMLPEPIIRGFCALYEGEEKFTVSVFMRINEKGKVKTVKFYESVIKVTANCEPKEIESLFFDIDVSSVGFLRYKYYPVLSDLENMFAAGAILKKVRQDRGAPEVDPAVRTFSRTGIRGDVVNVNFEKLSDPDRLSREIISAAGVEIAKIFKKHSIPCPYRHRANISANGIKQLRSFLKSVCLNVDDVSDRDLISFAVDSAHGGKNEELILAKIKELLPPTTCSLEAKRHGGMASNYYVRFAYPVSRYSDLAVQRLIKTYLSLGGEFSEAQMSYMEKCAERAVRAVNENETKVKKAQRRMSDLYALEYLNNNSAKIFGGTVWSVEDGVVTVCLDNSCVGVLKGDGEYVPGQRLNAKVYSLDSDAEIAYFQNVPIYEEA